MPKLMQNHSLGAVPAAWCDVNGRDAAHIRIGRAVVADEKVHIAVVGVVSRYLNFISDRSFFNPVEST